MYLPTCKEFLRELGDFLDQTLDPATRRELEKHVNECPNCWVVMNTTEQTIKVYKGHEAREIPEPIRSRVMEALKKKIAAKKCGQSDPPVRPIDV